MKTHCINVLCVDDMAGIRCLLGAIVKEESHNSFYASNGVEALEILETVHIDLVFLDIKLPVMDGLEVLENIELLSYDPHVVALTGFSEQRVIDEAFGRGANKCILKPFNVEDIRHIIREIADEPVCAAKSRET